MPDPIPAAPGSMPLDVITPDPVDGAPAVLRGASFSLSGWGDRADVEKVRDEVMDKVRTSERRMAPFYEAYDIIADSWRIRPRKAGRSEGKTKFNSKSGETHRATETLASAWFRMLTHSDPSFDVTPRGLNPSGLEVTEEELFMTSEVLSEQMRAMRFRRKLFRTLRSVAAMGMAFVEMPFTSRPYGFARKKIEFTDWVFRPLYRAGFDMSMCDIEDSDYVYLVDFPSKGGILNQASLETSFWDNALAEKHIKDYANGLSPQTDAYNRLRQSRSRAGYRDEDLGVYELLSYHGRLGQDNRMIDALANELGVDPKYTDFSVSILDGMDVVKLHMTQYGDWHTRVLALTFKDFEDEPLPYGIGQLGRKLQREQDIMESLISDKALFDILNMWKIGKFSGYEGKNFIAEPMKAVELEDVSQLLPLTGDTGVLSQALALLSLRREDFRDIVGAKTNLQAAITKASATETAIAQNEAIRGVSVHAELLAEAVRSYLEISHVNNLNHLDEPVWVSLTGGRKPVLVDKRVLPASVGFKVKVTTDKDFRPDEMKNILQALQILTSVRNFIPTSINSTLHLVKELFRKLGMNPALLSEPRKQADVMEERVNKLLRSGGAGALQDELEGEVSGAGAGGGTPAEMETPMGPVPTSPNPVFTEGSA